jgi:hypothetical protein
MFFCRMHTLPPAHARVSARAARTILGSARASRANFGASPKCFSIQLKEVVGEAPTTAREAACAPLTQIEVRAGLALQAKLRVLPGTP